MPDVLHAHSPQFQMGSHAVATTSSLQVSWLRSGVMWRDTMPMAAARPAPAGVCSESCVRLPLLACSAGGPGC